MTDEESANDWVPRATATELPEAEELTPDAPKEPNEPNAPSTGRGRTATFAVGRGLVILVAAAVGYQFVIPTHHVDRNRLSLLAIAKPGIAAFEKVKAQSGVRSDAQTGLSSLTSAAKKSPNRTGLYSIEWAPSQTSAAGVVAFLLPDEQSAKAAVTEIDKQQLSPNANAANSLKRTDTFTVPGVPGSAGAVFSSSSKNVPSLSTTLISYGRVVSLAEVIGTPSTAKPDSITLTVKQYAHMRNVEPGFTLSPTRYPTVATIVWAAGAAVLALLAAFVPILWRRRAEKRRRAREAELASRVVVRGQVIVKHRR